MEGNTFARPSSHNVLTIVTFIILSISSISSASDDTYIENSCNSATYPDMCYQSLSPYASTIEADPFKLCNVSLTVALKSAYSASSTISKFLNSKEKGMAEQVVQQCLGNVKESIGKSQDSLDAMSHLGDSGVDKDFQISSIKTWVSAAITNYQTCTDEFEGVDVDPTVRDTITKSVSDAKMKTSNALYFINNNLH